MKLVHKSVNVRPEVWRILRVNSAMSGTDGVPVRDYLTWLIEQSQPVRADQPDRMKHLDEVVETNRQARATQG